jgi:hypothetical protein
MCETIYFDCVGDPHETEEGAIKASLEEESEGEGETQVTISKASLVTPDVDELAAELARLTIKLLDDKLTSNCEPTGFPRDQTSTLEFWAETLIVSALERFNVTQVDPNTIETYSVDIKS